MTGRREKERKQLLDDFKEKRGSRILKKEALDHTLWRTRFGRGCGLDVTETKERINEGMNKETKQFV